MHVPRCSGSHLLDGLDIVVDAPLVARQQPLLKDGLGAVKVEHQLGREMRDEGGGLDGRKAEMEGVVSV